MKDPVAESGVPQPSVGEPAPLPTDRGAPLSAQSGSTPKSSRKQGKTGGGRGASVHGRGVDRGSSPDGGRGIPEKVSRYSRNVAPIAPTVPQRNVSVRANKWALNAKEAAFVGYYLASLNATQSAAKAGWGSSAQNMSAVGSQVLRKPNVARALRSGGRTRFSSFVITSVQNRMRGSTKS